MSFFISSLHHSARLLAIPQYASFSPREELITCAEAKTLVLECEQTVLCQSDRDYEELPAAASGALCSIGQESGLLTDL